MDKKDELTPTQYFNYIKDKKNNTTDAELCTFYEGCLALVAKYKITGQKKIIRKLKFLTDCVAKEREVLKLGINSFVYREDIEEYIDNIAKTPVKIIELENYPREIPDEVVDTILKTKNIFDQLYVVFTDYTGEVEKQVTKERREKDPILFGTFQKRIANERFGDEILINDRFYYLGDWVDEYCDLTMDKFIKESGKEKLHKISTPLNYADIQAELDALDDSLKITKPVKQNIFRKIKSVLKK
jgi:hypothetical protein